MRHRDAVNRQTFLSVDLRFTSPHTLVRLSIQRADGTSYDVLIQPEDIDSICRDLKYHALESVDVDYANDPRVKRSIEITVNWWTESLLQGDREKFKEKLSELMLEAFQTPDKECARFHSNVTHGRGLAREVWIKTDYDPDEMLSKAIEAAGVVLPEISCNTCRGLIGGKSMTHSGLLEVEVEGGYGSGFEHIPVTV